MEGQEYTTTAWHWDIIRIAGLTALTAVFLLIGMRAREVVIFMDKFVEVPAMNGSGVEDVDFEWSPAGSTEPLELTSADLDYQRVIMNVMDKPGFRWLGLYAVTLMVGVGIVLSQAGRVVEAMVAVVRRMKEMRPNVGQIGAAMSGTVRITAGTGVIYLSGLSKVVVEGMEEYASVLFGAPIAVVKVF